MGAFETIAVHDLRFRAILVAGVLAGLVGAAIASAVVGPGLAVAVGVVVGLSGAGGTTWWLYADR